MLHRAADVPVRPPRSASAPRRSRRLHAALVGVLTEARAALAQQVGDEVAIPKASERLFAVTPAPAAACFVRGDTHPLGLDGRPRDLLLPDLPRAAASWPTAAASALLLS